MATTVSRDHLVPLHALGTAAAVADNSDHEDRSPAEQPATPATAEALVAQFEALLTSVRSSGIDTATRSFLEAELHKLAAVAAKAAAQQQSPVVVEEVEGKAKEDKDHFYSKFVSQRSAGRIPSTIRKLFPLSIRPGMITLAGGMPNPAFFPFSQVSFTMRDGSTCAFSGARLDKFMQYTETKGVPELVKRIRNMQEFEHRPPVPIDLSLTNGSQDGLAKAFEALLNPGDTLLVEEYTYCGSLSAIEPTGANVVGVPVDDHGARPDSMRAMLESWDEATQGRFPRVMYLIPTGGNPTGCSLTEARKREIYALACKYDMLIMEDDPYYFMQFEQPRVPSFLSMDVEGRVLRFDSFSKILSSGMRVGIVTGPASLVERVDIHTQTSNLQVSGLSQAALCAFMEQNDMFTNCEYSDKFEDHIARAVKFYKGQAQSAVNSMRKHLEGLVEFRAPQDGMFIWMKVLGVTDTYSLVMDELAPRNVLFVPGSAFTPGHGPSPNLRAAFALSTPENMDIAFQRLGEVLRARAVATTVTAAGSPPGQQVPMEM